MQSRRETWVRFAVLALLFACASVVTAYAPGGDADDEAPSPQAGIEIKNLPHGAVAVKLQSPRPGRQYFWVTWEDGRPQRFTPNDFARLLYDDYSAPYGWLYTFLNISTPVGIAWVVMGMLGQLLFTGRMIVQWLASERSRRSVVPPIFWWLSLIGATMLLVYFIWRRDPVGVFGQATGWFIYVRNLWLIHRPHCAQAPEIAAA